MMLLFVPKMVEKGSCLFHLESFGINQSKQKTICVGNIAKWWFEAQMDSLLSGYGQNVSIDGKMSIEATKSLNSRHGVMTSFLPNFMKNWQGHAISSNLGDRRADRRSLWNLPFKLEGRWIKTITNGAISLFTYRCKQWKQTGQGSFSICD